MIGRLFCFPQDPRQLKARVAAEYCKKQIKVVEENVFDPASQFSKLFVKGTKVPAFIDDIQKVQVMESSGIAYHIAKVYDATNQLLGKTKVEESQIAQWIFYADTNLFSNSFELFCLYNGYHKYDKAMEEKCIVTLNKCLTFLDKHLLHKTYFGSESISLADIIMASSLSWLYSSYLEEKDRKAYQNLMRWFSTCLNQNEFKKHHGEFKFCEKRVKVKETGPAQQASLKNEKATKQPKEAKPAAPIEVKEVKKKHPCEELPPTAMVLDEWKRVYSNNDTRPTAIDWFWNHYDSNGYSVWHVQYKYAEELTKTFMTSNLIGGFFQRIERARKYAFGSLLVIGEDNDNTIEGYFVFRGQDVLPEVADAPDYPSFSFTKVDVLKNKQKFEDYLAWDGESFKTKKCADGKIFK
eukprot:NODE_272_length_12196_cov_0.228404.p2 type:complete len:409 gc:universal NODE_272_length_12196_cov_0.228404:6354-7580(+)